MKPKRQAEANTAYLHAIKECKTPEQRESVERMRQFAKEYIEGVLHPEKRRTKLLLPKDA